MASPREELEQAIARGDYAAAAQYAGPILKINPSDPYANFAVGMDHFGKRAWGRAAEHLQRCVKQKPDEPVFLNNLAIVLLYTGRYDEALKHAQKALKIQPDSEIVKDTISQIKKARDAVAGAKKAAKKPDAKKPDAKKSEKKPVNKKESKKKAEPPPKPSEGQDAPEQTELEGLVPSTPAAAPDMM
jgi:Flp pilus assembly protein TadD